MLGAWTEFSCDISAQAQAAFDEAIGEIVGVTYSPVAVASQVVKGMNYAFFCNADTATLPHLSSAAMVNINQEPGGPAKVTGIVTIEH